MRLVIAYCIGDGCTYHCDVVLPVVYESAEAFIVAFEEALQLARKQNNQPFILANHSWQPENFYWDHESPNYELPDVMTVDEWFHRNQG